MIQCLSFYTYCSTLALNCSLYTDIKRTIPVSAGYISNGTTSWLIGGFGTIVERIDCVYSYRAFRFGSLGAAGTISWIDCNGVRQSVYNDGSPNWTYIVPCALEGSIIWSGSFGAYMNIGFPCDCGNINTCESYTITASRTTGSGVGSIVYVDCDGITRQIDNLINGQVTTLCARKGSVWNFANNDNIGNINNQGVTGYTGGGTRGIVDNGNCNLCPPLGTYLDQYCSGFDLYYTYANGSCGTYDELYESNSPACGGGFYPYYCNCGNGCVGTFDPCYYYGCFDC
jgi:hypothetical protein